MGTTTVFDLTFEGDGLPCARCRFDIDSADPLGGLAANIKLAEDRANNVRAYLIAHHGIPAERVVSLSAANLARPLTGERGRFVELSAHSSQ